MVTITGKLVFNEDKKVSINMQLSPANPEMVDIPLEELIEEFIGKSVHIDILPVEPRYNKGGK
jgi:hypothetical protein